MTVATPHVPAIDVGTYTSDSAWFEALAAETTADYEMDVELRAALIEQLADLSTSDDGLDWDALARINIKGWGSDEDSE
jgi:hypothetical protein